MNMFSVQIVGFCPVFSGHDNDVGARAVSAKNYQPKQWGHRNAHCAWVGGGVAWAVLVVQWHRAVNFDTL